MTVYSYAQLEQLWINAGGPKTLAPLAAAIAEAESSGNSQAINPYDNGGTQTSWGLWQISNGTHQQPVPDIMNPAVNAQQAVAKYRGAGNSFSPWGTYDTGAYKPFLNNGTTPDKNVPGATGTSTDTSGQAGADCAWSLGGQHLGLVFGHGPSLPSTCVIKKTEVRAFIGGTLLLVGGVVVLAGVVLISVYTNVTRGPAGVVLNLVGGVPGVGKTAKTASKAGSTAEKAAPKAAREPAARQGPRYTAADERRRRVATGQAPGRKARKSEIHHAEERRKERRSELGELREVEPSELG